jgi:hypothetical protein
MEIQVERQPVYILRLSAEEITSLWDLMYHLYYTKPLGIDQKSTIDEFFNKLEDARPGGGFHN